MKILKITFIALIMIIVLFFGINKFYNNYENDFQNDADIIRLEHLLYWTDLIEKYYNKIGYYPLQKQLKSDKSIGLVRISTIEQQQYFNTKSKKYIRKFDNNSNNFFEEFNMKFFLKDLEYILEQKIDEKYDIQKVPDKSPVGYNYFITDTGYLFWVTCITCGVTKISTLLADGITPTVNIVSSDMKDKVTKLLTRKEIISNPIFMQWIQKKYIKESFAKKREYNNKDNSKTN